VRSGPDDVLTALRAATSADHDRVETTLGLLDPELSPERLVEVLHLLHGFWRAAESGLDGWAAREPAAATGLDWDRRRRAALLAGDLAGLGADPERSAVPDLPAVPGTEEALGRLYVLEGSTLGGAFIDRHLAGLPSLSGARLRAFSPYGRETGAMWQAFRRAARDRVADGGDADRVVAAGRTTFGALAAWCDGAIPAAGPRDC
jgi:heme oxygenase